MPSILQAAVTIPFLGSTLPRDETICTFWFASDDAGDLTFEGNTDLIVDSLQDGYAEFSDYLAAYTDIGAAFIRLRQVDSDTGDQIGFNADQPFSILTHGTGPALPAECAVCCTTGGFAELGDWPATEASARSRRGRFYVGPLDSGVVTSDSVEAYYGRPSTAVRDAIALGAKTIGEHVTGGLVPSGISWVVYSRAVRTVTQILGGYVDNEFDTQRRRGMDPTERTEWGLEL